MLNDHVLHVDAHLLVIDKPAGLAVHPGPKTPRSLEDHLGELRLGFHRTPQPAHRLDRDTSGCLVLGRHPRAVKRLGEMFANGQVEKTYWAVLEGAPEGDEGVISAPLLKVSTKADGWRVIVDSKGKPSRTRWKMLERRGVRSLVAFFPETGRTHQVRVHAAHLGCPIAGDPVYGRASEPMRLHAREVSLTYSPAGGRLTVTAEPPPGFMGDIG